MLLSNIGIGDLDRHPAPDDHRPRRAQRACEGAVRGVEAPRAIRAGQPPPRLRRPAGAPRAKAGVWGGAPLRT
jgi:hypothetical protein